MFIVEAVSLSSLLYAGVTIEQPLPR